MPEPVVMIGPASEPASPNATDSDDAGLQPDDTPKNGKAKAAVLLSALGSLASGLFVLLVRGLWALAEVVATVAGRYPRHSLAAGASVMILGAIWYTQMLPGSGARAPVPNQIKGESGAGLAKDGKSAAVPKTDSTTADPGQATTASAGNPEAAKAVDTLTAHSDASAPAGGSAPAPAKNDDDAPPLPSLADAQPGAKETGPAAGQSASTADVAAGAKSDLAPSPAAPADLPTPTLLAGPPPEPAPSPSASAPVVKDDKGSGNVVKPGPAMEAPTSVALTPAANLNPLGEPAPASDSLQLATKLEPAGGPNQSTQTSASKPSPQGPANALPQPLALAGGTGKTDIKPDDTHAAAAETQTAEKPQLAPIAGPATEPSAPISAPESTKTESIQSESPKSEAPKPVEPALGNSPSGLDPKPEVAVLSPGVPELAVPGDGATNAAKPPVEGSAPRPETSIPGAKNVVSQPAMTAAVPVAAAALLLESKSHVPDSREPEPRDASVNAGAAPSKSPAIKAPAGDDWVSVPNTGKVPLEGVQDAEGHGDDGGPVGDAGSAATRDVRAHAAKDLSFELETPGPRGTPELDQNGARTVAGAGAAVEASSRSAAGRVESVQHVVERNENFWTISRLYYSSGRYYRALWKANADTFPDIKNVKVNDVIMVPSVEDLDPAYIDPPRGRAPTDLKGALRPSGGLRRGQSRDDATDLSQSSSVATGDEPVSTARTNRGSPEGVPVRRSSRTDPDLDLPPPAAVARRAFGPDRTGRRADRPLDDGDPIDEQPATRTAARPLANGTASRKRPVYKIRPGDTLRSIARDMLGDSHRTGEILDLNRDLIDDPSHLIVGQVIELPDDARTSVRRSASR